MPSTVPGLNQTIISAAGAQSVTPTGPSEYFPITAPGVANITVPAPTVDGIEITFIDEGGHAHTVVCTASLNGGTTNNELTFGGTKGDSVVLYSQGGYWWTKSLVGVTVS